MTISDCWSACLIHWTQEVVLVTEWRRGVGELTSHTGWRHSHDHIWPRLAQPAGNGTLWSTFLTSCQESVLIQPHHSRLSKWILIHFFFLLVWVQFGSFTSTWSMQERLVPVGSTVMVVKAFLPCCYKYEQFINELPRQSSHAFVNMPSALKRSWGSGEQQVNWGLDPGLAETGRTDPVLVLLCSWVKAGGKKKPKQLSFNSIND